MVPSLENYATGFLWLGTYALGSLFSGLCLNFQVAF